MTQLSEPDPTITVKIKVVFFACLLCIRIIFLSPICCHKILFLCLPVFFWILLFIYQCSQYFCHCHIDLSFHLNHILVADPLPQDSALLFTSFCMDLALILPWKSIATIFLYVGNWCLLKNFFFCLSYLVCHNIKIVCLPVFTWIVYTYPVRGFSASVSF